MATIAKQSLEGSEAYVLNYIDDLVNIVCDDEDRRLSIRRVCYSSIHYYLKVVEDELKKGNIKYPENVNSSTVDGLIYRVLGMDLLVSNYGDSQGVAHAIVKTNNMVKAYNRARIEIMEALSYISNKRTSYELLDTLVGEREIMERY